MANKLFKLLPVAALVAFSSVALAEDNVTVDVNKVGNASEVKTQTSNVVPVAAHPAVVDEKNPVVVKQVKVKKQEVKYSVKACASADHVKNAKDVPCKEYSYKTFLTNLPWLNDLVTEGSPFSTKAVNGKAANPVEQKKATLEKLKAELEQQLRGNPEYLGSEEKVENKLLGQYGNLLGVESSRYYSDSLHAHGEQTKSHYYVDLGTQAKVGLYDLFAKPEAEMKPVLDKLTATQFCKVLDAKVKANKGQSLEFGVVNGYNVDGVYKDVKGAPVSCLDYQVGVAPQGGYKTPTDFELTKAGVKFHYGELLSHAEGNVSVVVPYSEVREYLKPYYSAQLGKLVAVPAKKKK